MRSLTTLAAVVVLPMGAAAGDTAPNVKETINRGLSFLAKDSLAFRETKKCAECHHAPFTSGPGRAHRRPRSSQARQTTEQNEE